MGACLCDNRGSDIEVNLIETDIEQFKKKLSSRYMLNPFHNFTAKRQLEAEVKFNKLNENKSLENFISSLGSFAKLENKVVTCITSLFEQSGFSDRITLNVIMFILSNTNNNLDKKVEIASEIIKTSMVKETSLNLDNLRVSVKLLIKSSLHVIATCIILPSVTDSEETFLSNLETTKEDLNTDTNDCQTKRKLPKYANNSEKLIFQKIKTLLRGEFNLTKLTEKWENFILSPYIFASYSDDINIEDYNEILKEGLINRFAILFDGKKIIDSFLNIGPEES